MKKITLTYLLAAFCFVQAFYAQPVITIEAPPDNYPAQTLLPSGIASQNYHRGSFLITASELSAVTGTNISDFGFSFDKGTGSVFVNGTIQIWLQNTTDVTYTKGTSWNSALLNMISVYSGPMTIPAQTSSVNLLFNILGGFNYTGGGLYVAFDWVASSAPATGANYALYRTNRTTTIMGGYRSSQTNVPATLATLAQTVLRPVCIIQADNTATSEVGLVVIGAPGKVAESMHTGHVITADVKNASINTLNNINVTLYATGANSFSDVQTIPTLTAGGVTTISFTPFTPTALGTTSLTLSIPADENLGNNQLLWNEEITCDVASNSEMLTTYSLSFGNATYPSACLSRFNFNAASTLKAVDIAIGTDWSTLNAKLYGVLLDNSGVVLATTNTLNALTTLFNTVQTFTFSSEQPLAKNQDYYIGMVQTKGFFMGANERPIKDNTFYTSQPDGSNLTAFPGVVFGIDPIIKGLGIKVTQTSTVMCVGSNMTLKASGALTYTWSSSVFNPISDPNAANITVSPNNNEIYTVYGEDLAGCSSTAVAYLKVNYCAGVSENQGIHNFKLYPNPSSDGRAFISGLEGINTITVYNILGEQLYTEQTSGETFTIDLSAQPAGSYLIKITDSDNNFKTVKLLNQN